jgi:YVTN family beta-propeller protein
VFAIDARNYKVLAHFIVYPRPRSVDFLPDGSCAFIPSESVARLDAVNYNVLQPIKPSESTRHMGVRAGARRENDLRKRRPLWNRGCAQRKQVNTIKVGTRRWGMAISPDGKYLFTANGPSDDVSVVDLTAANEVARVKAGGNPWGVAVVAQSK